MNETLFNEMNKQINFELHSGYLYLAMSLKMQAANFKGYSNWLYKQYEEEFEHARQFIEFLQKRDMEPQLSAIELEVLEHTHPLQIAKVALEHERKVTDRIYKLHDLAKQCKDYATEIFLHSFISEQIEEEDNAQDIIDKFTFAGQSTSALYVVDRELAQRHD